MGLILGTAKNAANAGESNWLVPRLGEASDDPKLWQGYRDMPQCRLCGAQCEVWTREFRMNLQRDPSDWYAKVAARAGAEVLVTSEKSPVTIRMLDPNLQNTTLVLFKSPLQYWASVQKRPWKTATLRASMTSWSKIYWQFLDEQTYNPAGGIVFLSLDKFQSDPANGVKRLAEKLSLPLDESALKYWDTEQHYIGGNFNVYERVKTAEPEKLAVHSAPKPVSKSDREFIRSDRATAIYAKLVERSIL